MLTHSLIKANNNLPVILIPMDSVQSVTVLALSNTGSRYEAQDTYGIAHFFEHMVFKGTKQYPDALDLAAAVDGVGANFNAFTSKEYTGYYVKAASKHVSLALDVVSDMLLTPTLRQSDIDREKGVIIEELNMYVDTPARHISNLFDQMMFANDGLGHDIIGTKETIRAMTTQHFEQFLNQWYGLENLVLIIAGDAQVVGKKSLMTEIETAFSKGEVTARQAGKQQVKDLLTPNPISKDKLHVEHRTTEQAHFILGWPGIKRGDKDRYAASLLSTILGGNMSSRLFTEVREKRGLCYYVHSDLDNYHNTGVFGAAAGVDPSRVDEAIVVTKEQFTNLVSSDKAQITQQELDKAKAYIAGKMALGLEDSESVAQYFGMKQLLEDKITTPIEVLEKLQQVSLQEVQAVAQRLIKPGEMRLAIIGPFKTEQFKKYTQN